MYNKKYNEMDSYIIQHLKDYIKYHLERGYSQKSVKEALLKFGYTNKLLEKIIKDTKIVQKNLDQPYSEKDLVGETYYYLRSMIAEYITKQLKHGFNLNEIKTALIKYGHHKDIVEDAIFILKGTKSIKISKKSVFWISMFSLGLFIIMMTLLLDVNLLYTGVIFLPSVMAYLVCIITLDFFKKLKEYISLISVIITIVLFFSIFPALNKTDADFDVLIALNAVIAFIITYFYSIAESKREIKRNGNKS